MRSGTGDVSILNRNKYNNFTQVKEIPFNNRVLSLDLSLAIKYQMDTSIIKHWLQNFYLFVSAYLAYFVFARVDVLEEDVHFYGSTKVMEGTKR